MELDRLLVLLASVGTFIATIIIFFTLLESKKQRRSAYRPDFIFKPTIFEIFFSEENIFFEWEIHHSDTAKKYMNEVKEIQKTRNEIDVFEGTFIETQRPIIYIDCYNIGLGPAKKIEIEWNYKLKKFADLLNIDTEKSKLKISRDKAALFLSFEGNSWLIPRDWNTTYYYYTALPQTLTSEPFSVYIPESYMTFIPIHLFQIARCNKEYSFNLLPELKMKLVCYDVENNKHKRSYIFHCYLRSKGSIYNKECCSRVAKFSIEPKVYKT